MGVFESLIYPDNKNRAVRTSELGNDCASFTYQLINDKQVIDRLLKDASVSLQDAYKNIAQTTIPFDSIKLGDSWVPKVAKMVSPFVVYPVVTSALHKAGKAFLLSEGRIGESVFADLVGLPRWFEVGKVVGGLAAVVVVEGIIDAVDGAVNRSHLRDAIHSLVNPRIKLKQSALINEQVRISLQAVINAYDAMKYIPGITEEQLNKILENLINQHKIKVDEIDEQYTINALAELDKSRNSWTEEDK